MVRRIAEPPVGGTIDHILSLMPTLLPSAQRAARICVERPRDVAGMSGADLAEAAETSAATISRMSQALGFRGFLHLRMLLVRDLGASAHRDDVPPEGTHGWLQAIADGAAVMLQSSLASLDEDAFDAAAETLAGARRVLIAGTGGSSAPAQAAAFAFATSGRPCEAPVDAVAQQLIARVLGPGDVCLAVSSSGANSVTLGIAEAAAAAGATVIGVTGFPRSALAEQAEFVLVAGARFQEWDRGTSGTNLVQHFLLSALQMATADRMDETAERARVAVRDEVLSIVEDDIGGVAEGEAASPG